MVLIVVQGKLARPARTFNYLKKGFKCFEINGDRVTFPF
jgi:hypothetical protein